MTEPNQSQEMSLAEYKLRQEINEKLEAINKRLIAVESELNRLKTYGSNSPSQLHRAFAIWGNFLLAQIVIGIGFFLLAIVINLIFSSSGTPF